MRLPLLRRLALFIVIGTPLLQGTGTTPSGKRHYYSASLREFQDNYKRAGMIEAFGSLSLGQTEPTSDPTYVLHLPSPLALTTSIHGKKQADFSRSNGSATELCDWEYFVFIVEECLRRSNSYEGMSPKKQQSYRNLLWQMNMANPALMAKVYEQIGKEAQDKQEAIIAPWGAWTLVQFGLHGDYARWQATKLRAAHFQKHARKTHEEAVVLQQADTEEITQDTFNTWPNGNREHFLAEPLYDRGSVPTAKGGGVLLGLVAGMGYASYRLWHHYRHRYDRPYQMEEDTYFEEEGRRLQRDYQPLDL